jgi:hypothetical protein
MLRVPFRETSVCVGTTSPLVSLYFAGNQSVSSLWLPVWLLYKLTFEISDVFLVAVRDLLNFVDRHPASKNLKKLSSP